MCFYNKHDWMQNPRVCGIRCKPTQLYVGFLYAEIITARNEPNTPLAVWSLTLDKKYNWHHFQKKIKF